MASMKPRVRHWVEKLQVRLAAVAAAVVGWCAIWQLMAPADKQAAWVFLPVGGYARLAVFAGLVAALAAGCALATLSGRAEGALLATLTGVAAMSVRSGPMRTLLWQWEGRLGELFAMLAVEMLALVGVLVAAVVVVHLLRMLARPLCGDWFWAEPSAPAPEADPTARRRGAVADDRSARGSTPLARRLLWAGGFLAMELAVAMILLVLTFRSQDTGQIAFALAGSFFGAAFVAHLAFPVRSSVPAWLGPVLLGTVVYLLGAMSSFTGPGPVWHEAMMVAAKVPLRAALPVHWLGLGCGGAVAGFWASCRFRETPEEAKSAKQRQQRKAAPSRA